MQYDEEDLLAGAENRVRNLMWTVSGDYTLKIRPDISLYEQSRYIPLYDAVKQGAFARYFDQNEFGLYLVKKVYCGADEISLVQLAQLSADAAVYRRIARERPGVPELRRKAFEDLLEYSFEEMNRTLPGRLKIAMLREVPKREDAARDFAWTGETDVLSRRQPEEHSAVDTPPSGKTAVSAANLAADEPPSGKAAGSAANLAADEPPSGKAAVSAANLASDTSAAGKAVISAVNLASDRLLAGQAAVSAVNRTADELPARDFAGSRREALEAIFSLERPSASVADVIRVTDWLYNSLIDRSFERRHGDLAQVLAVTLEDLREFDWSDFLEEEIDGEQLAEYLQKMNQAVVTTAEEPDEKKEKKRTKHRVIRIDEAAAAKMYSYMELNFGRSYLSKQEQERQNRRLCRGAHADCSLYYTEGILAHPVLSNAQYVNARRHAEKNRAAFRNSQNLLARNVEQLARELRRSLRRRSEPETQRADSGTIIPRLFWRVGRTDEPGQLFEKTQKRNHSDFAVDLLIDASGSLRDRQSQVALQAYIIAEAFCRNRISLQITGFCSFWDYTVLQRFRTYDDPCGENQKLLNYVTSANNRDGLAIRAAGDSLLKRPEEGKILIVLSDGKPNDVIVNRPDSRNPNSYCGEYAVRDTALEVRRLRSAGVCVLGIFTGKETELTAEKKIFGRDFVYIRKTEGFSRAAGRYLCRLLGEDSGDF